MMRVALRLSGHFCSILVLACICSGQTSTGGLTGAVTDPAGAFVPAAALKLTNLDTNDARRQTTDETGVYTFTALPPGRYPLALVALTPGIRTHGQFMDNTATRSFAGWGNFSSNGGVADANEILVDGAAVTMFLVNAPSLVPPVDATQEFRVQTNNYAAEFGRSSGAVVNVGIKSGTNQLHGSLYEFLRNDKLDANDFF